MSIERVNIQTASFTLRAANIRGPQLRALVDGLTRAAAARLGGAAPGAGTAAMQSPAARFREIAPTLASAPESPAASGFAPAGPERLSPLDAQGLMNLVLNVVQRLVDALMRLLPGAGTGAGTGAGGSCASGAGAGDATPTKPDGFDTQYASMPRTPAGGCASGAPGPSEEAVRSRARPDEGGTVGRLLARIGKGALAFGASAVPGGQIAAAGLGALSACGGSGQTVEPRPACGGSGSGAPTPRVSTPDSYALSRGGSLEDQIFAFLSAELRKVEADLKGAMDQANATGGDGESRSAVTQKVQQLVQKRSEMVELLSNTMKTMHDSTQAVNRNIRS